MIPVYVYETVYESCQPHPWAKTRAETKEACAPR